MKNAPTLNMTITFLTFLSPLTAVSILSANKVHTIAAIISGTEINSTDIFSILFPPTTSDSSIISDCNVFHNTVAVIINNEAIRVIGFPNVAPHS